MSVRMFAFIRAINTGHRRLTNTQVLQPFHAAGLDDVHAYQAAGNVTFRTTRDPLEVEVDLSSLLAEAYGFDAATFVRSDQQLRKLVVNLPFTPEELASTEQRTQVTFLSTTPSEAQVAEVLALIPAEDVIRFVDRQWFWLPRAGVSDSSLPVSRIERIIGPMTMRTVGTVERMLAKYPE